MATKKFIIEVEEGDTKCEKCPFCRYEGEYKNCDKHFKKLDCYKYNLATMKIKEYE